MAAHRLGKSEPGDAPAQSPEVTKLAIDRRTVQEESRRSGELTPLDEDATCEEEEGRLPFLVTGGKASLVTGRSVRFRLGETPPCGMAVNGPDQLRLRQLMEAAGPAVALLAHICD